MPDTAIWVVDAADRTVWRVGRAPDPWAWIDRQYAGHQRWDDADGIFRMVYAGDSLYGCYVEVLAYARPDVGLHGADLLADIVEDPEDAAEFPVPTAGSIPRDWIRGRMVATARLAGPYADVRSADTIAARRQFLRLALLGYPTSTLQQSRALTPASSHSGSRATCTPLPTIAARPSLTVSGSPHATATT